MERGAGQTSSETVRLSFQGARRRRRSSLRAPCGRRGRRRGQAPLARWARQGGEQDRRPWLDQVFTRIRSALNLAHFAKFTMNKVLSGRNIFVNGNVNVFNPANNCVVTLVLPAPH